MTGNKYSELAMRTNDGSCKDRLIKAATNHIDVDCGEIFNACLGLSGEVGELNDMLKKYFFHGHSAPKYEIQKELGDILWYVALMCHAFSFSFDEIMELNIDKLKKRYPEGFSEQASQNREEYNK